MSGSVPGGSKEKVPKLEGHLVLVATPIGNLGDLSPRAVATLSEVGEICCEDTRRTRHLLTHAGISGARLSALHAHNEDDRISELIEKMKNGTTVAVVTDAGTPGISDPGSRLVAAAATSGIEVKVVPGPSAATAALVVSGLPTERFLFEGFLPRKGPSRKSRLSDISAQEITSVIYEAPSRVQGTLKDLEEVCGAERRISVARELTKLHEEVWRGTLTEATAHFEVREPRGEVVLVLQGAEPALPADDNQIESELTSRLSQGQSVKDAAEGTSLLLGISKRHCYRLALDIKAQMKSPAGQKATRR